jgi:hypothetical protein
VGAQRVRGWLGRAAGKRSVEGQRADDFCHDIACAHYECTLRVKDIRWPITE